MMNATQTVDIDNDNVAVVPPKGYHVLSIKGTQGTCYGMISMGWTTCPVCKRYLAATEHHVHLVKD